MFQIFLVMGQIKMAPSKQKNMSTPMELINMNCTMSIWGNFVELVGFKFQIFHCNLEIVLHVGGYTSKG